MAVVAALASRGARPLRERNSRVDGQHLSFGDWYLDWRMLTLEDLAVAAEAQSR
jgi:hypothetical protein